MPAPDDTISTWPGAGTFGGSFGISPAIDGTNVAFNTDAFVFRWDGQNVYAVNTLTSPLPDAPPDVKFAQIHSVAISGTEVAFSAAFRNDSSRGGVYATFDGQLRAVATTSTPVPGGTGTFAGFSRVSRSGDNVAFINASKQVASEWGRDTQYEGSGVYASFGGAAPVVIADTKTVPGVPGPSPFQTFREAVSISGRDVAFIGRQSGSNSGVFVGDGNTVTRAVTANPIPSRPGQWFWQMNEGLSFDGTDLSFGDNYLNARVNGKMQVIASYGMEAPDGRTFKFIDRSSAVDDGTIIFGANTRYAAMGRSLSLE
ncbi:MAG TPA: hypothetical protein VHP11_16895, partial [Tepidisphaeraceae bacterium]|nr:hypothetical protein [Tepidisphaeraceae bacterium]